EIFGDAIPEGEQTLILVKAGYVTLRIPVIIASNQTNDMVDILMAVDLAEAEAQIGIISLSEEQLDEDEGTASNVSGLLQASRDVFLSAASFDFSSTFFRPRGYDSESGKVLINEIGRASCRERL